MAIGSPFMALNSRILVVIRVNRVIRLISTIKQIRLEINARINHNSNAIKNSEPITLPPRFNIMIIL
ncbi:MAG: hypothetical protein ACOC6H_03815 [Thermoproteota archaeon]